MRRSLRFIVPALLLAAAGCAMMKSQESQIFSSHGKYDTATIAYRYAPATSEPASTSSTTVRRYTLLIQYPHPKGRGGYARAELIVDRPSAAGQHEASSQAAGFSQWWKRTVSDNLPGTTFGDGIEQALGRDVPVCKIDKVIDRLDETGYFGVGSEASSEAILVAKINTIEFRKAWRRVPELDAIVSELRHEGTLISRRQPLPEEDFKLPQSSKSEVVQQMPVVPAGAGLITRLPPVEPGMR